MKKQTDGQPTAAKDKQETVDAINKLMDERIADLRMKSNVAAALVRQRILLRETIAPSEKS